MFDKNHQKLVDLIFEIGLTLSNPKYKFYEQSKEENARWIISHLKSCGFPTHPGGSLWGVLENVV